MTKPKKKETKVTKVTKARPPRRPIPENGGRKVLGISASIKNTLIAVALLFAFLGGFFQVYNWLHSTFAERVWVQSIELNQKFEKENGILNSMYQRFCILDNMFLLSPDPKKVDPELRKEWLELKGNGKRGKLGLQEDKVKDLQKKLQGAGETK